MLGRDQETHYGSDGLGRICYGNLVRAHVCEVGSGLSAAPSYRLIVDIGEEALRSAFVYPLGPCGSMLGPSLGCRIPIVSRSIVEAAVTACPVGEIGEGLVEELQIVGEQLRLEFSDFNLSSSFHGQWNGLHRINGCWVSRNWFQRSGKMISPVLTTRTT